MFTLKIENPLGEIIELTHDEGQYQVIDVDGLAPPNATITNTQIAGMDGSRYASAKLEERNMTLLVKINGNVEKNRLALYRYFGTKQWCKIYYKNGSRDVYAEGYVETTECGLFTNDEQMQVSVICPDPYFYAMHEVWNDISQVLGLFEFPFAFGANGIEDDTITDDAIEFSTYVKDRVVNVLNEGEADTGVIIDIVATGTVVNPIIYNVTTRESFGFKITLQKGDEVTIDTNSGRKSIRRLSEGIETSLINKVTRGSTWLALTMGENLMSYSADEGAEDMSIIFKHRSKYKAV